MFMLILVGILVNILLYVKWGKKSEVYFLQKGFFFCLKKLGWV